MDRKLNKVRKVENLLDIGLVNYVQHPSNPEYIVFRFSDKTRADDFERLLKEKNVWFERDQEESRTKQKLYYLFGIHERDYETVTQINYEVESRNRHFIIKYNWLRWGLLLFVTAIIVFASVGYCSRTELPQEVVQNR